MTLPNTTWESEFDEKFYPIELNPEIIQDPYKTGFFWGTKETLEKCREYIRTLLTSREEAARKEERERIIEIARELGQQQEDDTIWLNMDDLIKHLKENQI